MKVKEQLSAIEKNWCSENKLSKDKKFEEAVKTLNSLQTNASTIEKIKKHNTDHIFEVKKLEDTIKYLTRTGVTLEKIDDLPLIHVSGTKGKGSTCAFCESILRHHGYKTGFYSSPHLVAVRERIRLNGEPLSQQDFTRHFWKVYNKLDNFKDNEHDMPPYFKFLTVMAFNVFLAEKVDVAIIEVGIGGEYDCTNVIRHVSTVGITSLALDHTDILGNTIEEIAWQKAGIMKPGSIAITVGEQPEAALRVLKDRATEKKSTLLIAPAFEKYDWKCFIPQLDFLPDVQLLNASLALQLANSWMQSRKNGFQKYIDNKAMEKKEDVFLKKTTNFMEIPIAPSFAITQNMANGLKYCKWPGRNQIITDGRIHYFLDGAHTKESLEHGADWFVQNSLRLAKNDNPLRVLVFNCTGNRNSKSLLSPLLSCGFHLVIFCPNITTTTTDPTSDQANLKLSTNQQLGRCEMNHKAWCDLQEEKSPKIRVEAMFFECVTDTLTYLQKRSVDETAEFHIFITGSLHLVGSVLSIIDPDLKITISQISGLEALSDPGKIIETCSS